MTPRQDHTKRLRICSPPGQQDATSLTSFIGISNISLYTASKGAVAKRILEGYSGAPSGEGQQIKPNASSPVAAI